MKKSSLNILTLVAVLLAQIAVPAIMINTYESTLEEGEAFMFKVVPIDPADPFRGRYVSLRFEIERSLKIPSEDTFKYRDTGYVLLGAKSNGFAKIESLSKKPPASSNYIKVGAYPAGDEGYYISLPFNRYYADEYKAPQIESAVWLRDQPGEGNNEPANTTTAKVRIKDGLGVIEQLYINDIPVEEFLKDG